jgi:hypothetical protein
MSNVAPELSKYFVAGAALADDLGTRTFQTVKHSYHSDKTHLTIVPRIVVEVDQTVCTSAQTCFNKHVILGKLGLVEYTSHLVVREILPADRETEQVVAVILDEMLHLTEAVCTCIHG